MRSVLAETETKKSRSLDIFPEGKTGQLLVFIASLANILAVGVTDSAFKKWEPK
jgi:hypothetical protein